MSALVSIMTKVLPFGMIEKLCFKVKQVVLLL